MNSLFQSIQNSVLFIRLLNWEYWPAWLVNIPTGIMWLYFAVRSRSVFFFTTVNPGIETGGVMGESKTNILNRIPNYALPQTVFVTKSKMSFPEICKTLKTKNMNYPLIAKPDIGERGFLVEKIENEKALKNYFDSISSDYLIQEFVDKRMEIGILYYRFPGEEKGKITSLCLKKTLSVIGDGKSSVLKLMEAYPRAKLQLKRFKKDFPNLLNKVPKVGEKLELEPIGNHSRGTAFLNGNRYIDADMEAVVDKIALEMSDIFYGRFDIKCDSIEKLKKGQGFKILEFNGVASEPAHIYDPNYSIFRVYKDIWKHWNIIFQISRIQRQSGVEPMSVIAFQKAFLKYRKYIQAAKIS